METFDLYAFRFEFTALETVHFPATQTGNIVRGAFGMAFRRTACEPDCPGFAGRSVRECARHESCFYARLFEPGVTAAGDAPSGLGDWPRPFVFRAGQLDGRTVAAGERFHFDVHVFEVRYAAIAHIVRAVAEMARSGLGPSRGRAELEAVRQFDAQAGWTALIESGSLLSIPLDPEPAGVRGITVEFVTPTELKTDGGLAERPDFEVLFARVRDRVATLRALYGAGPLSIDFRAMGERAALVRMRSCETRQVRAERRSSRTGQVHSLGGFVGSAEYEGDLDEFLPYLEAARWAGVGRQCVWGKGELRVQRESPP